MKLLGIFIISIFLPLTLAAQKQGGTMRIEPAGWSIGRIKEVDGPVKKTFNFTNTGKDAFVIEKVSVSCGCTSLSYTKEPVLPGKQGTITIQFDPKDRAGKVLHEVVITSRKGLNRNVIDISGEIVPRPRAVEDDYPFEMASGVRFSTLSLNFGYVTQGETKSMVVGYTNTSDKEVALDFQLPAARSFLKAAGPGSVCAGCRGEITVTYDLSRTSFYGRYSDRIYPVINGKRHDLPVSTVFTAIDGKTGASQKAPAVKIAPVFFNFGQVVAGGRLTKKITLANEGRSPLIVRWVGVRDFMSVTLKPGTVVEAGKCMEFTVTMDMSEADYEGVASGAVTIITNDPQKPVREVRFAATLR